MRAREVNISIQDSDVLARVRTKASYQAGKVSGGNKEVYDRIEIAEADEPVIHKYWDETKVTALGVMEDYCDTVELLDSDDKFSVKLIMPTNFDDRKEGVLNEAVTEFCVNLILQKWYEVVLPENVKFFTELSAEKLSEIEKILMSRMKPMRRNKDYKRFTEKETIIISGVCSTEET